MQKKGSDSGMQQRNVMLDDFNWEVPHETVPIPSEGRVYPSGSPLYKKKTIDIRLNGQTMELDRDEIKSIIPYLRFGTNELKILTKPVEIKELIIEKNEFLY